MSVAQSCPTLCDPMDCSQAPLSTGFSRQESWSGLPCPPPTDLSDPGIKPTSPVSPALQADSLPAGPSGKPQKDNNIFLYARDTAVQKASRFLPREVPALVREDRHRISHDKLDRCSAFCERIVRSTTGTCSRGACLDLVPPSFYPPLKDEIQRIPR